MFDVFISCGKYQNTLQLNTCVKYCTKDQRNGMSKTSEIHCTDFNALNAMYVGDIRDGVCGFYATLYAEYRQISCQRHQRYPVLCIQWPLTLPGGKAPFCPFCGFSSSPPCNLRRQLCLKMFWNFSNYKGDSRQDTQPIPYS